MSQPRIKEEAKELSRKLLKQYFKTMPNYLTRHHIQSYDQFLEHDIVRVIQANNPLILMKEEIPNTKEYQYKLEIFVGGLDGKAVHITTPTIALKNGEEIRVLLPNEARLRNLTYQAEVMVDITVRITYNSQGGVTSKIPADERVQEIQIEKWPLFKIPILLHSRYCILNNKPEAFLREAGECPYDQGGYFIIDGSERVLVTVQEAAFNTLYLKEQVRDPKVSVYGTINCISPTTRVAKRVSFYYSRDKETIEVRIPFVRKAVPLFVVFRALGVISDKDIMNIIFPDPEADETKILQDMLIPSMRSAFPFLDTYSSIQYIKTLTKGFSEEHVIDILQNQFFLHISDKGGARVFFLAECVRRLLQRVLRLNPDTSRDDIRNQRCLTSGFLTQQLFQEIYKKWRDTTLVTIDKQHSYQPGVYSGRGFERLFDPALRNKLFQLPYITEGLRRAFRGKWGSGLDEERGGAIQALSRMSYLDFLSHCRRMVLNFDTSMKLTQPRQLHTSQFGYFCTSETPGGSSIGITKNLSLLATISTGTDPTTLQEWLFSRGGVYPCYSIPQENLPFYTPVYINGGTFGYTQKPLRLVKVLKLFKRTGCLSSFASVGFDYRNAIVFIYLDDGRPMRPLIYLDEKGNYSPLLLEADVPWEKLVLGGSYGTRHIYTNEFRDPIPKEDRAHSLERYIEELTPKQGAIEYVDPYEQNEAYISSFPDHIKPGETSHIEVHPSTIVSILTGIIPFANHNQSPRNQLGDSQSKQGVSVYATNYMNRYDTRCNILCYGEAPLVSTMYYDMLGEGKMTYGTNLVLAIGSYTGYNQDDGILFNKTSFQRGLFNSINFRCYEGFEEDDPLANSKTRIAHPKSVLPWKKLKLGVDYSKLDDRGIIRAGEMVTQDTVLIGRYIRTQDGEFNDASVTPQVWTSGRVESVIITINNAGLQLVKVRITQFRYPELGDKFSNRHGQKGTIGMMLPATDMPRTAEGLVPDMIMNPHAIPSRMTIAQLLEMVLGKLGANAGSIGDGTLFMNEGDPSETIGKQLMKYGLEPQGNQVLYNGQTGTMINANVFIGNVFTMRLDHMVEDKWNARGAGRRERRTHQPTGGRGNEGGLRIGEMERDGLIAHGIMDFTRETMMKRADGTTLTVCNGCGTVPIFNESQKLYFCPLCDGPVQFTDDEEMVLVPSAEKSFATFSKVEIPFTFELLNQELQTYANIYMRYITGKNGSVFRLPDDLAEGEIEAAMRKASEPMPVRAKREEAPVLEDEEEEENELTEEQAALLLGNDEEGEEDEEAAPKPTLVESTPGTFIPGGATTTSVVDMAAKGSGSSENTEPSLGSAESNASAQGNNQGNTSAQGNNQGNNQGNVASAQGNAQGNAAAQGNAQGAVYSAQSPNAASQKVGLLSPTAAIPGAPPVFTGGPGGPAPSAPQVLQQPSFTQAGGFIQAGGAVQSVGVPVTLQTLTPLQDAYKPLQEVVHGGSPTPPVLIVRTDPEAMVGAGLEPVGGVRNTRRAPGGSSGPRAVSGGSSESPYNKTGTVTINKLG